MDDKNYNKYLEELIQDIKDKKCHIINFQRKVQSIDTFNFGLKDIHETNLEIEANIIRPIKNLD